VSGIDEGGLMAKIPRDRGWGWIEWVLIVILVVMVLVTVYLLLRPALIMFWQNLLESLQQ
jgi:hypothetical protein